MYRNGVSQAHDPATHDLLFNNALHTVKSAGASGSRT